MINNIFRRIKRRMMRDFNLQLLLWRKMREFKNNKNFNLDSVCNGFENRFDKLPNESKILHRIIQAYKKAKEAQKLASPCFQVSNEWLPIYEKPLQEVMSALENEKIDQLSRVYNNFMRDNCSVGLIGLPVDMEKNYFGNKISKINKKRYLCDFIHRYNLWESLMGATHQVGDLSSPNIGNPYGLEIDGTFIKTGADYLHYYATLIGRLTRSGKRKKVVELGGGYGGMAYYLIRDQNDLTYIDFDLPENLALTSYYLLNAFPNKKIKLFGEIDLDETSLHENDIFLMPNFEITKIKNSTSVDLIFNSYSLAEMSSEAIKAYIVEFMQMNPNYILHINHNKNSVVVADDFGIDSQRFDLLYKIPALWNAGRSLDMDEYEYLYKKS